MQRFGKPCKNVANISDNICQLACNERRMLLILPGVYKLEKYFLSLVGRTRQKTIEL